MWIFILTILIIATPTHPLSTVTPENAMFRTETRAGIPPHALRFPPILHNKRGNALTAEEIAAGEEGDFVVRGNGDIDIRFMDANGNPLSSTTATHISLPFSFPLLSGTTNEVFLYREGVLSTRHPLFDLYSIPRSHADAGHLAEILDATDKDPGDPILGVTVPCAVLCTSPDMIMAAVAPTTGRTLLSRDPTGGPPPSIPREMDLVSIFVPPLLEVTPTLVSGIVWYGLGPYGRSLTVLWEQAVDETGPAGSYAVYGVTLYASGVMDVFFVTDPPKLLGGVVAPISRVADERWSTLLDLDNVSANSTVRLIPYDRCFTRHSCTECVKQPACSWCPALSTCFESHSSDFVCSEAWLSSDCPVPNLSTIVTTAAISIICILLATACTTGCCRSLRHSTRVRPNGQQPVT